VVAAEGVAAEAAEGVAAEAAEGVAAAEAEGEAAGVVAEVEVAEVAAGSNRQRRH
jgi:hypothetical protein